MKYSATPTEELRDLLIDKLIENPNDIVIEDSIDYITNTQKEITRLEQENKQLKEDKKKARELIKRSAGYKGICTQPETDTFSTLLEILGENYVSNNN